MKKIILFLFFVLFLSNCADHKFSNIETVSDYKLACALHAGSAILSEGKRLESRAELERRHPEWDWNRIDSHQIKIGMVENEAITSWGWPDKINHASYGDQWVYEKNNLRGKYSGAQYLYFENGALVSWNES